MQRVEVCVRARARVYKIKIKRKWEGIKKRKEIVQSSAFSVGATYAGRGGIWGGARERRLKRKFSRGQTSGKAVLAITHLECNVDTGN